MKNKEFIKRAVELQNDTIKAIVETMNENNIALISFVTNGDHSDFDVDKAFVFVESGWLFQQQEIIAVYTDGKSLYILSDNVNIQFETIDILGEHIAVYKDNHDVLKQIEDCFKTEQWCTADEFFNPTDTLVDLLVSVEETIECIKEK